MLDIFKAPWFIKSEELSTSDPAKLMIIDTTLQCIKSSERDLLELYKMFNERGYLDQDERLCTYIQDFVEMKFEILPI